MESAVSGRRVEQAALTAKEHRPQAGVPAPPDKKN